MEQTWILIDTNTGLHVAWYFWLRVLDEVNRATRYGIPFGLLLLECEAGSTHVRGRGSEPTALVPPAIRSTDLGGFIAPGRAAVLLTHQDAESAEQARDRILARLASAHPGIQWMPQLFCFPQDAAEISSLLTSGWDIADGSLRDAKLPA